jgi:hypothetical protein
LRRSLKICRRTKTEAAFLMQLGLFFDWKIRNLTPGRRKALLHVPIENADQEANVVAALWLASDRLLRENPPGDGKSELDIQLFGTRLLMARLIVGGLQGASDRRALLDAALLLRELSESAQLIRSKNEGKSGRLGTSGVAGDRLASVDARTRTWPDREYVSNSPLPK